MDVNQGVRNRVRATYLKSVSRFKAMAEPRFFHSKMGFLLLERMISLYNETTICDDRQLMIQRPSRSINVLTMWE